MEECQKRNNNRRNFVQGDIFLVADASSPQCSWVTAGVNDIYPDQRGMARSVKLQMQINFIERPISKICLLQRFSDGYVDIDEACCKSVPRASLWLK